MDKGIEEVQGRRCKVGQQKAGCAVKSHGQHYTAMVGTVGRDGVSSQEGSGKVLIKEGMRQIGFSGPDCVQSIKQGVEEISACCFLCNCCCCTVTELSRLRTRDPLTSAHLLSVVVKRIPVGNVPDYEIIGVVYKRLPSLFKVLCNLLDMEFFTRSVLIHSHQDQIWAYLKSGEY